MESKNKEIITKIEGSVFDGLDITYISNSGSGTIQNQINTALNSIDTNSSSLISPIGIIVVMFFIYIYY